MYTTGSVKASRQSAGSSTWRILGPVTVLDRWARAEFAAEGVTHPTYRRGTGPGVIVVHELPGITPEVITFAEEVVDAGFTVIMPKLFGTPGASLSIGSLATTIPRVLSLIHI